ASAADPVSLTRQATVSVQVFKYLSGERRYPDAGMSLAPFTAAVGEPFRIFLGDEFDPLPGSRMRTRKVHDFIEVNGTVAVVEGDKFRFHFTLAFNKPFLSGDSKELNVHSKRYLATMRPGETAKLHGRGTRSYQLWVVVKVNTTNN